MGDKVLRTRAAARLLGVSEGTLRLYCQAGLLPHRRAGSTLFFSETALQEWAKGNDEGNGKCRDAAVRRQAADR